MDQRRGYWGLEARRPPKARWTASVFRWSNPVPVDGAQRLPLDPEGYRRVSPVLVSLAGVGATGAGLYHPLQACQASGGFLAQDSYWALASGTGQHRVESLWGGRMEGASAWLYQTAHLEEASSKPKSTDRESFGLLGGRLVGWEGQRWNHWLGDWGNGGPEWPWVIQTVGRQSAEYPR